MAASIISRPCPSCRGMLQLTPDLERFRCYYCGKELIVERVGSVVSLATVEEKLKQKQKTVEERPRERAADEVLLQHVVQEREATASALAEDRRRLGQVSLDNWTSWYWERRLIISSVLIAFGGAVAALDALARGITGQAGPVEAVVTGAVYLLLGVLFLSFALVGWSRLSDRRQESAEIQARQRALRDKVGQLRDREADIRRRLNA